MLPVLIGLMEPGFSTFSALHEHTVLEEHTTLLRHCVTANVLHLLERHAARVDRLDGARLQHVQRRPRTRSVAATYVCDAALLLLRTATVSPSSYDYIRTSS